METIVTMTSVELVPKRTLKLGSLNNLVEALTRLGLAASSQEQLWVVSLDGINQLRTITSVAVGTYHHVSVALPTIFTPVLLSASDRFIIAHNHPNGSSKVTSEDEDLTARVEAAADVLDMSFDDHLILTPDGGWVSMRASGYLKEAA